MIVWNRRVLFFEILGKGGKRLKAEPGEAGLGQGSMARQIRPQSDLIRAN